MDPGRVLAFSASRAAKALRADATSFRAFSTFSRERLA
jgi:hypothetical protein